MVKSKYIWLVLTFLIIASASVAETTKPVKVIRPPRVSGLGEIAVVRWYDSYETAVKMAKIQKKPILIDFTASWCGWCEKMDKEIFANKDVAKILEAFVCVRIDVDKNRDTAYAFSVKSLPRVFVINTHSEIVGDWLGYRGREDFSQLLEDVLEYTDTKTGAIAAPKVSASDTKAMQEVKKIMVDLSSTEKVIEMLASKDPALRQAVIAQIATSSTEAMTIATTGLESKYLGIRIASWELMKKIYSTPIDYDPWASTKRRNELLKSLNKSSEKPAEK